jgi:hypothetical protein
MIPHSPRWTISLRSSLDDGFSLRSAVRYLGLPSGSHPCERQYKSRKHDNPHRLLYTNNGSNQENHT